MKKKKKVLLISGIVLLIAAAGTTAVFAVKKAGKSSVVSVYPMDLLNNADFMDESGSSLYGTITSEYVQEVQLDGTKDVKKVYVKEGDTVKEGDKLLKYNVDEEELELQLQELQIKSAQLEIENMEKELKKLRATKTVGSLDVGGSSVMNASVNLSPFKTDMSDLMMRAVSVNSADEKEKASEAAVTENKASESSATQKAPPKASASQKKTAKAAGDSEEENSPEEGTTGEKSPEEGSTEKEPTPEEKLEKAKETAAAELKEYVEKHTYAYTTDKNLANTALQSYTTQIKEAEDEKKVSSLKEEAMKRFNEIAALEETKNSAKKELTDYLQDKRYGKDDNAKKSAALNNATEAIEKAETEEAIEEGKSQGLASLKEIEPLYLAINDADNQKALSSGSGEEPGKPIRYFLAVHDDQKEGTVTAEVIKKLMQEEGYTGRYVEFRLYKPSEYPEIYKTFTIKPGMELSGDLKEKEVFTIDDLKTLITEPIEPEKPDQLIKALNKYNQKGVRGKGTSSSKYTYYLNKNCLIKGSVINKLIALKKYAVLKEYESEAKYAEGSDPNVSITITPNTLFKENISNTAKYTVSDLKKLLVSTDSVTVTPKKKNLKSLEPGKTYTFKAEIAGKNTENLPVVWSVKNNKSKDTVIAGGILKVGDDETAKTLKIVALAGGKKGSLTMKVKKVDSENPGDGGGIDDGGGDGGDDGGGTYTKEELQEEIAGKEEELAQAKQDLSEAKINYKEAKKEVDSALVKATVSGKVTTAYSAEDMPTDGSAAIVVRADEGMYVKASVSEMNLDTVQVGGKIKCTSYESGEEYEAVVKSVSDFPVSGSSDSYGSTNPNSSYYPIVAYIEDAEGLSTGENVSITYNSQSMGTISGDMIVLQKAYIRTEDKKSYVYKEGKNGRLEKQYVKTGTTIYGQYVQILSGLTLEDNVAFPYGKNVEEGAKVKLSEDQESIIY